MSRSFAFLTLIELSDQRVLFAEVGDAKRRRQAGAPVEIRFQTKPDMALGQIRSLANEDVPRGVVLADAAYGNNNAFREELEIL